MGACFIFSCFHLSTNKDKLINNEIYELLMKFALVWTAVPLVGYRFWVGPPPSSTPKKQTSFQSTLLKKSQSIFNEFNCLLRMMEWCVVDWAANI